MGTLNNYSPLRYPGGKAAIADTFSALLDANGILKNGTYCEPFAGGAGVALTLLLKKRVGRIIINDYDPCIVAFWMAIIKDGPQFIQRIKDIDVSIDEWVRQRKVYNGARRSDLCSRDRRFQIGFATFFLNRCNRSGILPNAGPIGGFRQEGKYLIDARFRKDVLCERIQIIYENRNNILVTSDDAEKFLDRLPGLVEEPKNTFLYLDPPYYERGNQLYLNFYGDDNHRSLAKKIAHFRFCPWVMTYDDCESIRAIYGEYQKLKLSALELMYSMQKVRKTKEILITPEFVKGVEND